MATKKQEAARDQVQEDLFAQLVEVAGTLGLKVRVEQGQFRSERCRRRDEDLIILNRRLSGEDRVVVLAGLLSRENLEGRFIRPALRELIRKHEPSNPDAASGTVPGEAT